MAFVIPIRRLGVTPAVLTKAIASGFSRGIGEERTGHSYTRRQFIGFKNGKRVYRYWYANDMIKTRAAGAAVAADDEHFSIENLHKFFAHLAKNRVKPSEVTEETLRGMLGVEDADVTVSAQFLKGYHGPWIEKERAATAKGETFEPPRYPLQRAYRAFQMIPDSMRAMLGETLSKVIFTTPQDPSIADKFSGEDEDGEQKTPPAGFADLLSGATYILADGPSEHGGGERGKTLAFDEARGWPRFGSPFTWSEEVIWHELGHQLHEVFRKGDDADKKKVWKAWLALGDEETQRISEYAYEAYGPGKGSLMGAEDWAESISCLISHPKQLARQCPKRYAFLREHCIPGPSVEEILATPDSELAWWDAQPATVAGKALSHARARDGGAPSYAEAYHSDKDQFYSMMVNGRSIFFRVGPADKEEEKEWLAIPDTIDPETGLPVMNSDIANRFRQRGTYKEIYDEHGQPLTSEQALLYLRQDEKDTKWAKSFPKKWAEIEAKLASGKGDETTWGKNYLGRQVFDSLGENKSKPEEGAIERERERVKEARSTPRATLVKNAEAKLARTEKKGKSADESDEDYADRLDEIRGEIESLKSGIGDPAALDRHAWAPHPLSKEDFERLTPTFKFTKIAKAEEQPHVRRVWDRATKSWATKVARDPVTGKDAPVLTRTLYEMPNPDGTKTVIPVNSQEPFEVGQTILVPQLVTRKTRSGLPFTEQAWVKYKINADATLTPTEKRNEYVIDENTGKRKLVKKDWPTIRYTSTDAVKLARDCNTSAESLLEANGRYAAGQITDPLLASLINPGGVRIRNEGDLAELMRKSAKEQTTTWITVQGDNDAAGDPSFAHVKVTFDGGGNPLISGEYWNRQLGLSYGDTARMDSLLDAAGKFKLEAVREVKPRKLGFFVGGPARYRDPNTGRMIYGTIGKAVHEPGEGGGFTGRMIYTMMPIKGQGTHFAKRVNVFDTDVQSATSSIDVDNIRKQRRDVEPLKSHMLLYADNLRIGVDGALRGATVRVKLPADGSITMDEIRRLPAMKRDKRGELIVDLKDIHTLREVFGGFVMDKHVTKLLADQQRTEKRDADKLARKDVIVTSQIVGDDGGVNTNPEEGGLLKGLREFTPDGKRFKLASHQEEFLRFAARAQGRCMAAHFMGTGKTVSAIAAIQMFKNAKQEDGSPIPGAPRKRVAVVVPLNTAAQWEAAVRFYTDRNVTLIGASSLPNSRQAFNPNSWPDAAKEEGPAAEAAAEKARLDWIKENPRGWDPTSDKAEIVIIPWQYFQQNERDLRQHGDFDGIIVDEAHGFAKESERSKVLDSWNPNMNMMMLLTGTPITNTLDDLPGYVNLLSNGKSPLGTREEFKERFLIKSSVLRAHGGKGGALTDLNPNRASELGSKLSPYIHVANSEDVKGKTMPAVLLDENQPAHMIGVQEKVYRLAMAAMTTADADKMEQIGILGADEKSVFTGKDGESLAKKINIARAFANSPGYKPPNDQPLVQWEEEIQGKPDKKTGEVKVTTKKHELELPNAQRLLAKPPHGFDGKWPSRRDVNKLRMAPGEYEAMSYYAGMILGKDYDKMLAGKKIDAKILDAIGKGTVNGQKWGKVANPEYGPEGAIARGTLDDAGNYSEIEVEFEGETIKVPQSTRFIRDPNRKAQGVYYYAGSGEDWGDWDPSTKFSDAGEEAEGEEAEESDEGAEKKKGYKPLVIGGKEYDPSIQRSPFRRRERAMFDAVLTAQNAKCDEMQRWLIQNTSTETGGNRDQQFILFGNRVGSSCRTMESKLRTMGYMDINEALGNEDRGYSNDADKARKPKTGKYFVTYFGKSANLGDRDLNSEVFRKVKDSQGKDTDTSMFVHRMMTGSVGSPPKVGEYSEGWSPTERQKIAQTFAGTGKRGEMEAPMRVTKRIVGGAERFMYVYESSMTPGERKQVKDLELQQLRATDLATKKEYGKQLAAVFERHLTEKPPITQRAIDILNSTQIMVASDAAQVGLNWGNASKLGMYDSLHSPMQEWQRITRAARMLDAAVPDKAKPLFAKLDKKIKALELAGAERKLKKQGVTDAEIADLKAKGHLSEDTAYRGGFMEYNDLDGAMPLVQEAWDALDPVERSEALDMLMGTKGPSHNPIVAAEAYFANRALERIRELRPIVKQELKQRGRALPPREIAQEDGTVQTVQRVLKPEEIVESDVTNEIIEKHLSDFDRMILRGRKYLVDVKRFTTSVNMPVMETSKKIDERTGKTKKIRVPTGQIAAESPAKAELTQMTSGRAKQAPYEFTMEKIQQGVALRTNYDHLAVSSQSLASLSQSASAAPVLHRPKKVRVAASRPATPPEGPPTPRSVEPLSPWKQKQYEAVEKWQAARRARAAKLEAGKAARVAQYEREQKKKRKLAAQKALATKAAKKKAATQTTKKSSGSSRFAVPFNTFMFGAPTHGES